MDIFLVLEQMPALFYGSCIVLGLLVGSFLNVVIHRLPVMLHRGWKKDCIEFLSEKFPDTLNSSTSASLNSSEKYNLVVPRSACPHCGHKITALENIPVLSYLFLKGACHSCKAKISIRYPLIEILSAILATTVAWHFGFSVTTLFAALLTWSLICLTFIDYDHQYLPDQITLPFLWLGLLVNLNGMFTDIQSALLGAVAGYLVLWIVFHVFKLITKKEGMGFGDFKLLAMLGAWLGWQLLPAIILISSVIGSIVGIILIVFKLHDKSKPIPFGPYLAGAGWVALLWGNQLNQLYFDLVLGTG
jgi:leader peptidase (prepilin peptidase)/N-methyltransferase